MKIEEEAIAAAAAEEAAFTVETEAIIVLRCYLCRMVYVCMYSSVDIRNGRIHSKGKT